AEDARALIAGEARAITAGAVRGQGDAQVSATAAGIRDGRLSAGLYERPVERGVPAETAERGADEELEGDHRRDGIARESEGGQRVLAGGRNGGEGDGLARTHVDEPEMLLGAELSQRGLDEIVLAHRHPRRGDEEIAAEPPLEARLDVFLAVGRHAQA